MSEHRYWRRRVVDRVIDQLRRDDSPPRIDREPRGVRGLSEDEPAAPWLSARGEQQAHTKVRCFGPQASRPRDRHPYPPSQLGKRTP